MTEAMFKEMANSVVDGDEDLAPELAQKALDAGIDALTILEEGFFPGMQIVGEAFEKCEMWLPEIVMAAGAMEAAMEVLRAPLLAKADGSAERGTVVLGTAKGDVHDIGKNIVRTMLTANGFTVHDLGKDVAPATFIARAEELNADVIAISALMTSTMLYMPEVIEKLKEKGLRDKYKVVLGGAPVVDSWARQIGADGYSDTATACVTMMRNLLKGEN